VTILTPTTLEVAGTLNRKQATLGIKKMLSHGAGANPDPDPAGLKETRSPAVRRREGTDQREVRRREGTD
jgi:hypothetical protein